MGIQDVAGLVLIALGFLITGRALPPLIRAGRSKGRLAAIPAGVWSGLLAGPGIILSGIYLRGPQDPHATWVGWIPGTLTVAGLMLPVVPWIMSRRRARRLDSSPAGTPSLGSAPTPDPDPAIAVDAKTAGLIERIKTVRFSTTRLSPGYDEEEVDAFLDKLVAALSQDGQLDRSELREVRFSTTRMRPGYGMPDVNAFLEEVAQATW
jgi:DivIVA domain-containing protein